MKRFNSMIFAASVAALAGVAAAPAVAAPDVSFGVSAPAGDANLFFSISSQYFHREPRIVNDWGRRFRNPDDLAVFFYVVQNSRSSPEQVYALRQRGMSWYEVGNRCGMPFNAWYVAYDGVPRGRYAKPYRHYERYRHDARYSARLSDRDVRDLVAVRMAHDYYGVSPQTAMDWRRDGSSVEIIMTREYRNHGHDRDSRDAHNDHGRGHDDDRHDRR